MMLSLVSVCMQEENKRLYFKDQEEATSDQQGSTRINKEAPESRARHTSSEERETNTLKKKRLQQAGTIQTPASVKLP